MAPLFDAHSHLPDPEHAGPAGWRVVCGTGPADWAAVLAHAANEPQVIPMLGLHPWQVAEAPGDWLPGLEALLRSTRACVGECGLDFARKDTDACDQEAAFRPQLRLARALQRPAAIHCVRAWGRLAAILREEGPFPDGALVHAFSGSAESARELQAMGLFISFSGDLLDPARRKVRSAFLAVDEDHLLLESDGAAELDAVYACAATLREMPLARLTEQIWKNGRTCFKGWMA